MSEYRYLSVADIVALYGLKRSYVYKRACVDNWRRIYDADRSGGKPYAKYHIDDIDASLGRDPAEASK